MFSPMDMTFSCMISATVRVTLEDFTVIEDANNGTDVMVSVVLKEYRKYQIKSATVTKDPETGKVTAKFENERQITGNISPFLKNFEKLKGIDDTTIEIHENTTLYNITKQQVSKGSRAAVSALKKANPTVKNVVQQGTKLKSTMADKPVWAGGSKYMSTWADKPAWVKR